VQFKLYPRQKSFFENLRDYFGNDDEVQAIENFNALMTSPVIRHTVHAVKNTPHAAIELRAVNIPE
jgi:protease-4